MAGPIRQPIDVKALERYIEKNVPEIKVPIDVKQFGYGQSNPTYQLIAKDGEKFVMRKKPPGKLLSKTAHRVDREYRILHALENTDVAVPKTYCFSDDDSIVGTPFYIMKYLAGRIFEDPSIPDVSPEERTEMWHDAIRTLAKFHRLNPASVNMSSYGKPSGFYNRQIHLFWVLCEAQSSTKDVDTQQPVGHVPHHEELMEFFSDEDTQPKDRGTFLHGDYKIDNMVFHPTEPRVIGILDWEMSTIGHPLADLCNMLFPYITATNPVSRKLLANASGTGASQDGFSPGKTPGLPTYEQCIKWYSEVAGWGYSPRELSWGNAMNAYKGSVIMQGIAARFAVRQASSEKAKDYADKMPPMGEVAFDLVQNTKKEGEKATGQSKL